MTKISSILTSLILFSAASSQADSTCPALEGKYNNCKVDKIVDGIKPEDIGLELPEVMIFEKSETKGQLTYLRKTSESQEDLDPNDPERFADILKPGAPQRRIEINDAGITALTAQESCADKALTQVISTEVKDPSKLEFPPIYMKSVYSKDGSDFLYSMSLPGSEEVVSDPSKWTWIVTIRCSAVAN